MNNSDFKKMKTKSTQLIDELRADKTHRHTRKQQKQKKMLSQKKTLTPFSDEFVCFQIGLFY